MFDSRSKIIKIGGYLIIGVFILIMVIAFGMPDFLSSMSNDENKIRILAVHNIGTIRIRVRA